MAGVLKTRFEYGDDIPMIAGAAITAARLVKWSALGNGTQGKPTVIHTAAAAGTDPAVGVARHDAASGSDVTVTRRATVMLLEAGATVTAGSAVMSDNLGRVINATGAGRYEIGTALHGATVGGFVWVLVSGFPGVFRPA
jgi:hypothetical protein